MPRTTAIIGPHALSLYALVLPHLPAICEVLPHDICRGGDRGDGVEKVKREPYRKDSVLLPHGLRRSHHISRVATKEASRLELHDAEHKCHKCELHLHHGVGVGIENKDRGATHNENKRYEP